MVTKVEREKAALAKAEAAVAEKKKLIAKLEAEELEKNLDKAIKSLGKEDALAILEAAAKLKPETAIKRLNGS
ncbi:MAG: hypothetical protein AAFR88_10450 [Pseudomonadota bacterium]